MRQELSQYLSNLEHVRNRRPGTVHNHKKVINRFFDYLEEKNVELENVDLTFVRQYLRTRYKKNLRSRTMYSEVSTLRVFFRYCYWKDFIETDFAKDIISPKFAVPLTSFLTEREMEKFLPLPILAFRDYALLEILYATGAFASEIINIKIDDIDFNDRSILIRREMWRKRIVFFGRKAEIALKAYLNVRPLLIKKKNKEKSLFLDHRGKRMDLRLFGDIIEKYWLLSGLERKITAKSFRHSFAAHLLDGGTEPYFVQELMGHKHLVSTERYGRISVGRLKKILKKYHPRSSEQAERNNQPRKDVENSFRSASLIRY